MRADPVFFDSRKLAVFDINSIRKIRRPMSDSVCLAVNGLEKRFGGVVALTDYDIEIRSGELVGLIGPNGAGKTTVFNLLSGVLKPTRGTIFFKGQDITRFRPDQNAVLGIARTFQNIRLFNALSVKDNIKAALHPHMGCGLWKTVLNVPGYRRSERRIEDKSREFLDLLGLLEVENEPAENLPYGLQRRVEIGRALAVNPSLLLLDEPAAGLNPNETEDLIQTIRTLHQRYNLTIFLVEHDMRVIMTICSRIQVLDMGHILAEGDPVSIRKNSRVIAAYLGQPESSAHA